jgi:hypothetical protein
MRKPISMAYFEALAAQRGIKPAPADHPIYSEGTSIIFVSARSRKPSKNMPGSTQNLPSDDRAESKQT